MANEEPSRSLLGPAALVGIGVVGSLYQAFTLGHPVLAHAGVLWRVP